MTAERLTSKLLAFVIAVASCSASFAQGEPPVRVVFDKDSPRIDIVSGHRLPDYTQAQRSSFQFFNGRLDKPDNGFWYYFDGRRFQGIDDLAFIRNVKSNGCWIMGSRGRNGQIPTTFPSQNCEIEHHAVSFIPLNPSTGAPDPRVYILLDDIHLIQWAPYDHWAATVSQGDFEAMAGIIY